MNPALVIDSAEVLGLDGQDAGPVGQIDEAQQTRSVHRPPGDGVYGVDMEPGRGLEAQAVRVPELAGEFGLRERGYRVQALTKQEKQQVNINQQEHNLQFVMSSQMFDLII